MPTWEQLALLLLIAAILIAAIIVIVSRVVRRTPQERERRRRLWVSQTGRLGDATVTEVQENTIYYSYSVRGVFYTAAQDVAQLREFLPEQPERLIGPVA